MVLLGDRVCWNEEGDFSRKELRQVHGNFCVIPLENFTMQSWM